MEHHIERDLDLSTVVKQTIDNLSKTYWRRIATLAAIAVLTPVIFAMYEGVNVNFIGAAIAYVVLFVGFLIAGVGDPDDYYDTHTINKTNF